MAEEFIPNPVSQRETPASRLEAELERRIDARLDDSIYRGIRPISVGLGALYVFLAVSHALTLPGDPKWPMTILASGTSILLFGLWLALGRWSLPIAWGHPMAAAVAGLILLNSLMHLYLLSEIQQTTNVALLIIGVGAFFLSRRWFVITLGVILLSWLAVVTTVASSPNFQHFLFMQIEAVVLAVLIHVVRLREVRRLVELHIQDEYQREELRRQALTFDNILDSVILTDMRGRIIDCNPATESLFGYTRQELLGQTPGNLWHSPGQSSQLTSDIVESLQREGRWSGEIDFVHKDGSQGVVEAVVVPLLDRNGQQVASIGVSHDITERVRGERELYAAKEAAEAANRAKSAFLANMSHELRTPLNAIIGYSELLEEELAETEQAALAPDLAKIRQAGKQLLALINDVLDLSKIEADRMELSLERFDVGALLKDVIISGQPLFVENSNAFQLEVSDDLGTMYADSTKLRQVLLKLLSNAAKFTESGQISLFAWRERSNGADWIRFDVTDTGIGMSQEQVDKLFEPFVQADPSIERKRGGTGLGLAISQRFCQMMGGGISVESRLGEGSTFSVRLPAEGSKPAAQVEG